MKRRERFLSSVSYLFTVPSFGRLSELTLSHSLFYLKVVHHVILWSGVNVVATLRQ